MLIALVLGTIRAIVLKGSGVASPGQENPERNRNGIPTAAETSSATIGLRKSLATTMPSPDTASTKGSTTRKIAPTGPGLPALSSHIDLTSRLSEVYLNDIGSV